MKKKLAFLLLSLISFSSFGMTVEIGCKKFTTTSELEQICIDLRIPPILSKYCFKNTSTSFEEKQCLYIAAEELSN